MGAGVTVKFVLRQQVIVEGLRADQSRKLLRETEFQTLEKLNCKK